MFIYTIISLLIVCTSKTNGITTIHHNKPDESTIPIMANKMKEREENLNITLSPSERQKRLLPYESFYHSQPINQREGEPLYESNGPAQRYQFDRPSPKKIYIQYNDLSYQNQPQQNDLYSYQTNNKFTPFSESNAIPGPFRPMIANQTPQKVKVQYLSVPQPQSAKVIDYSAIYDKLSQLKLQNSRRPAYVQSYRPAEPQRYLLKPQTTFVPERNRYKTIQPTKTIIETYTATNIDIPNEREQYSSPEVPQHLSPTPSINYQSDEMVYKSFQENTKPYINQQIAIEIPQSSYPQQNYQPIIVQKVYQGPKHIVRKPYIVIPRPPGQQSPIRKPVILIQRKPIYKTVYQEENADYVTETPKYESVMPHYEPQYTTPKYQEYQTPLPVTVSPIQTYTEDSNSLGQILKQLQATNTLPETLTADNIDNSIKTLVRILEALKKRKFSKPIVVPEDSEEYNGGENETGNVVGTHIADIPGSISQSFPAEDHEGGTPGKPGVDYPALSSIPQTSFNCKTQRYKGFFGDPDTNCQVWHYCDLNGGQASFLCPNGTIFSQVALTCDWWYNVKCSSTAQLYVLNERLYKYIIPLSPKFPEDYSGPLVDKYLAMKFQEMEEKMRKEKKGKGNASKESENEEAQSADIEITTTTPEVEEESTTNTQQRETLQTIEDDNDQK